ncbi:alkane 1-monooxygenase [Rhodobacteraceae bacterium NNCM2]|nr:alkane 1-monooxygenase [Coraliihabitans acroporae]
MMVPTVMMAGLYGGWYLATPFILGWVIVPILDRLTGLNIRNLDTTTSDDKLFWHRAVTIVWVPIQVALILWCLWLIGTTDHLPLWQIIIFALALGAATGGTGVTYSHELIHQKPWWERILGEILVISTCYGPFATEHVYNHHANVCTPRDPVTARRGEWFYTFFPRAVAGTMRSSWNIERSRAERRGRPYYHWSNPFWRYTIGSALFIVAAYLLAGWLGVAFFLIQSLMAIYQLEAVNYVEHYGLTREYLGNGKFERVKPHHSWNASQRWSNWFLLNLQRHSDHHYRPNRRYPLLQHHDWSEAPQLPHGYATMIALAIIPPAWFYVMHPRLDRWRNKFYPHITDWSAYDAGTNGKEPELKAEAA